jgi:hypothetical protein
MMKAMSEFNLGMEDCTKQALVMHAKRTRTTSREPVTRIVVSDYR